MKLKNQYKIYRMRLVETLPTLFGDYSQSDQWDLIVKAMEYDFQKKRELKFRLPKHKDKVFIREYIGTQVNGVALLKLDQDEPHIGSSFVWILLKSVYYGVPYLVIKEYAQRLHPHHLQILTEMVESAFNWVLKGTGVKLVLEPWETDEEIIWERDYSDSIMNELHNCKDKFPPVVGYQDAVENQLKMVARNAKRRVVKDDRFEDYILLVDKKLVMTFLRSQIKIARSSKKIAMPFRLLSDRKLMKRVPYRLVMSTFPELEGRVSDSRFDHWNNTFASSYKGNSDYEALSKVLDKLLNK